jgi:hypothetical protein
MRSMASTERHRALKARIEWPCRLLRLCGLVYAGWVLFHVTSLWSDPDYIARAFSGWYGGVPALADPPRRAVGFASSMAVWSIVVAGVVWLWRLTGRYMDGQVFSVEAAIALKRIGQFGIAATALDIALRPVIRLLLSPGVELHAGFLVRWIRPEDLLYAAVFGAMVVLAIILESAASMSDEVDQFV